MDEKALIREAFRARERSYSPYSNYRVGAALLTKSGRVYHGCNIENASFTPTNCAERTAFFKAVSEGETEFEAIAVVGAAADTPFEQFGFTYPCGVCRQVMREFCDPHSFRVITARSEDDYLSCTLEALLPYSFGPPEGGRW